MNITENLRIRRLDGHNIVVEEFQEGGKTPVSGKMGKPKWKILGYFSRAQHAAAYIVSHALAPEYDMDSFLSTLSRFEQGFAKSIELLDSKNAF